MSENNTTNKIRYCAEYPEDQFIKLPATARDIEAQLKTFYFDQPYLDIFSSELEKSLSKFESDAELNYLAVLLNDMCTRKRGWGYDIYWVLSAIELGKHTGSVKDLINLILNMDCYYLFEDIMDEEQLGRENYEEPLAFDYIEGLSEIDIPDEDLDTFDFDAYGKAICEKLGGEFVQDGYVFYEGGFIEHYKGHDDFPDKDEIMSDEMVFQRYKQRIGSFDDARKCNAK